MAAEVHTMNAGLTRLDAPDALRDLPGWLIWKLEPAAHPGGKPRKVPYYADGGRRFGKQGTREDRARLTTFAAAKRAAARRGAAGVGFALMPEFNICSLDFDGCVSDGVVNPDVERLVTGTYAEFSPSGTGVRAFMRGALGNRKDAHGGQFGFETFSTNGFVTWTGEALPITEMMGTENTVASVTDDVLRYARQRFGAAAMVDASFDPEADPFAAELPIGLTDQQIDETLAVFDPDCSYHEWVEVGMALHHESEGGEDGFEHWRAWSEASDKYPGDDALRDKWDTFGRTDGLRPVTARTLVKKAQARGALVSASGPDDGAFEALAAAKNVAESAEPASAAALNHHPATASADEFSDESTAINTVAVGADAASAGGQNSPETGDRTEKAPPARGKARFPIVQAAEFASAPPPDWLIKGVIPRADLAILFGASGSGKTFVALDVAMAVARGTEWRGRRVKAGPVVYVAAEGGGGMRKRLAAYARKQELDLATVPFGVLNAAPNMLERGDAVDLAKSILDFTSGRGLPPPSLVVLDTLAQVTPGANENAGEDMGKALAHCAGIRRATGATVMLVHHSGKDSSKGARGWSGLRAAADVELEVVRRATGRLIRTTKQKDGDDFSEWGFDLEVVKVGFDEDGDVVDSCVAVEAQVPIEQKLPGRGRPTASGKWQAVAIEVIEEFALAQNRMAVDDVVAEVLRRTPLPEEGKRDTRRQHVKRALTDMCQGDAAPYFIEDGWLEVLN